MEAKGRHMFDEIKIVSLGGAEKVCRFAGFLSRGGWFQVRYPGGAGLFAFSLRHGRIECKRGEHAKWRVASNEQLDAIRAEARRLEIKFSTETPRARIKNKPARPAESVAQRQGVLFDDGGGR